MKYKKIHIWEFPPTRTFIHLDDEFRKELFFEIRERIDINNLMKIINQKSINYNIKRNYNTAFFDWRRGYKKENGVIDKINVPLWALIEISKILSNSHYINNEVMRRIEKHIVYYTGLGKAIPITDPKLPVLLTPEMTSIIFHLCGDGHVGSKGDVSHYRQTNQNGLHSFLKKLQNSFGAFKISIFEGSKVIIPHIITDFYVYYFGLNNCSWNSARIPQNIKNMPKDFLVAGLSAFIVDEGYIGDFIEIYSKNYHLLNDIKAIILKLGYQSSNIKKKYRYGKFDSYRIFISPKSIPKFYKHLQKITGKFPTCGLAQKSNYLEWAYNRKQRKWSRRKHKQTKNLIVKLLANKNLTTRSLANKLNIGLNTTREHLQQLEEIHTVSRVGKKKRAILWTSFQKI